MSNTQDQKYAEEFQLPLDAVGAICGRMREEEDLAKFGTVENWAYKRKVKLGARTAPMAQACFEELTTAPDPEDIEEDIESAEDAGIVDYG